MKKVLIGILALGLLAGCSSNNSASGTVRKTQDPNHQSDTGTVNTLNQASKPSASQTVTAPQPSKPTAPSPHNYEADIEHDVSVLKSKATIPPNGVQFDPIIDSHPDAEVPDGFGGMLYAWNVVLNGNGDGTVQQIYFFDNNRYLGRDTANDHGPSGVHAGSTGSIIATYAHYRANDANCCPSGQPFTVTFHWDGSRLAPDSVATLNEVVNDQFK
jgi:hypothetical protein